MAWTTPGTATAGEVLTAAFWNEQVRDNMVDLDSRAPIGIASALSTGRFIQVRDEKASGTSGGTFTSGAYQTRTLNTVVVNTISGASLASNQVTLPAGSYFAQASALAHLVNNHQLLLRNVTDSSNVIFGNTAISNSAGSSTIAILSGAFTISASKAISLQHRCGTTKTTDGFGAPGSFGNIEVYADLTIWKTA